MTAKVAILDIAGGLAERAGASSLGARLHAAHANMGARLDGALQRDFPAATAGMHIPMPSLSGGRLHLAPWTKERQSGVRQAIAYNPEALPAILAPVPGAEVAYLGAKALARRAAGVPVHGVPGGTTSLRAAAAHALGPATAAVRTATGRAGRSLRDFFTQEGTMPTGIKTGSAPEHRGRDRAATFSTGVEAGIIASGNAVLDGLFARKAEMAARTEQQIADLFKNKSYGRNRSLGPTAAEAASYLERARASGALG